MESAEFYFERGNEHYIKGNYQSAIDDYSQAIKLDPEDAGAFNNRGSAYHNLKQDERAIEDYDQAIELDPQYAVAFNNRGYAYHDLKQDERAIEDYDQAIELDPQYAVAFNNRGYAFRALSSIEETQLDWGRFSALADEELLTIELPALLAFYRDHVTAPYLAKHLMARAPQTAGLLSYQGLLERTHEQCEPIDLFLLYLEKKRDWPQQEAYDYEALRVLIHFYMGFVGEAFRLYNDVLEMRFDLQLREQYYFVRSAAAFLEPVHSQQHILSAALDQARTTLSRFDAATATPAEVSELYYAGQLFYLSGEHDRDAHHCFTQLYLQFPPAAYMQVLTLGRLGRLEEQAAKAARIRAWEARQPANGMWGGFTPQLLLPDDPDPDRPFRSYAYFSEVQEAVEWVRADSPAPFSAPPLWEALLLSDEDRARIRKGLLNDELQQLGEERRELFTPTVQEKEKDDWTERTRDVFTRLQGLNDPAEREAMMVSLIEKRSFRKIDYDFFIRYLYYSQGITLWQTFSLLLFLENRSQQQPSALVQEAGKESLKELIKRLIEQPTIQVTGTTLATVGAGVAVGWVSTAAITTAVVILAQVVTNLLKELVTGQPQEYDQIRVDFVDHLYHAAKKSGFDSEQVFEQFVAPVLKAWIGKSKSPG
jgi:Tfp pilus assembly protein PilF